MEDTVKVAALPNVHTITTSINNNDDTSPESPSHNRNIMISLPSMQTSNEISTRSSSSKIWLFYFSTFYYH